MNIQNKYASVIITGAGSGLGLAFAEKLAECSGRLLLISKNRDKLETICQKLKKNPRSEINFLAIDLTDNHAVNELEEYISNNAFFPDLFINNAGIGAYGGFISQEPEKITEIINLNISAAVLLCRLIAPIMKNNGGGSILNVSSTIAFRQAPNWAVYSASKAFLLSLTRSLAYEYIKTNVKFSALCPGKIDTNFDNYAAYPGQNTDKKASPECIVKYTLEKLDRGKELIIPGFSNHLKYHFFKHAPDLIVRKIIKGRT